MSKPSIKFAVIALASTMFLGSCGNSEPDDVNVVDVDTTGEELEDDPFESPDVDYHLPSPLQVASIFKKSGLEFNSGVANDPDNADSYTDELKKMLNFGVYSADMAYCVLNEQSNEGRIYLEAITALAGEIGMEAVFENKDLMERFDANLENKDSIEILMIDIHERTEEYMEENDMQHNSAIHFAGAWTEGMYLGVFDYENNGQRDALGAQITEQMEILKNIILGLKDPKNDGMELGWIISDLENIQSTFKTFDSYVSYYEDETSTDELQLTDAEYEELGGLIKDLRAKIINA